MKVNTNGEKDYRTDLYERIAERFGVGTKSGGIDRLRVLYPDAS